MTRPTNVRVLLATFLLLGALTAWAPAQEKPNIIWECGQNVPNSAYWKKHGAELEAILPFDGVMLKIEHPVTEGGTMKMSWKNNVGWKVFGKERVTEEMVRPFVEDMKAAGLKKLTHNLVGVCPYPYPNIMNWFDDDWWDGICQDITIVAKAAKDAGCVGIVFDPEQYGPRTRQGNWRLLVESTGQKQSYEEYDAEVRRRGRAFGKALSAGFPDCTILFFHGYSLIPIRAKEFMKIGRGKSIEDSDYALYAPWLDGMLEGTSDGTVFVDGYESSYSYVEAEEFEDGRWNVRVAPAALSKVPELFGKKTRCAFGLWMDNKFNDYKWYAGIPDMNFFNPGRLQRAIHLALKYSDGYVWLWNEQSNWYLDGPDAQPNAPAQQQEKARGMDRRYRTAVADAKGWPGVDTTKLPRPEFVNEKTLGFVDREALVKLLARTEKVMDLPNDGWLFKPDRADAGASEKWYLPATATDDWDALAIGEFWERQLDGKYSGLDGIAWYRREIALEELPENKRLYLSFGAVDESLALWIDGEYVGAYDRGGMGWDKPFAIEVTDHLTSGKHTLIMRTRDIGRMGGLWKPIELIAE